MGGSCAQGHTFNPRPATCSHHSAAPLGIQTSEAHVVECVSSNFWGSPAKVTHVWHTACAQECISSCTPCSQGARLRRVNNNRQCHSIVLGGPASCFHRIFETMFVLSDLATKFGLGASNLDVLEARNSKMMLPGPKNVIKTSKD